MLKLRKKNKKQMFLNKRSKRLQRSKLQYLHLHTVKPLKTLMPLTALLWNKKWLNQLLLKELQLRQRRLLKLQNQLLFHKRRLKLQPFSPEMSQFRDQEFSTLTQTINLHQLSKISKKEVTVPGVLQLLLKVLMRWLRKQNLQKRERMKRNSWLHILCHHQRKLTSQKQVHQLLRNKKNQLLNNSLRNKNGSNRE